MTEVLTSLEIFQIQAQTLLPLSSSFRAKLAQRKIGENYENIRVKHIFDILSSEDVPKTPLDLALLNLFNTIRKEQLMVMLFRISRLNT